MKRLAFGILASTVFAAPVLGASLQDAMDRYSSGDAAAAASIYGDLAAAGDPHAQFNMALMFYAGEGVPQSYTDAFTWAWRAKLQGIVQSEVLIGRVIGSISNETRTNLAQTLTAELSQRVQSGDGRAMLAMSLIQTDLLPRPNAVQSYVWQSMAVAVGMTNAAGLRDATFAALSNRDRALAQSEARSAFAEWCATATKDVPSCTVILN